MALNSYYKDALDKIITFDEGGWRLTSNSNDPDGGWTFAGVTLSTWIEVYPTLRYTNQQMAQHIASDIVNIKERIYFVYEKQFVAPLGKYLNTDTVSNSDLALLSCAINIGAEKAISLCEDSLTIPYYKFLTNWRDYYIDLVEKNAAAWKDWANHLEMPDTAGIPVSVKKPTTFRAPNLKGWLNRIERYR